MGRRNPSDGFGLVAFGAFTDADRLPSGTLGGSYDQAGPGPGEPEAREAASTWRPAMSGAQSEPLEVATAEKGGYAGIDGARVVVRIAGETQERDWRGWSEPNLPTSWTAPQSGWGAADFDSPVCAVLPSGRIAVIATVAGSTTEGQSWTYDPRTGEWVDKLDWSTTSGIDGPLAIAYDPIGQRLIVWTGNGTAGESTTQAFSSTDEGATWTLYARGMWPMTVDTTAIRVAVDPNGREWLATHGSTQLASNDNGISWREVGALVGGSGGIYVPIRTRSGWLIAYIDGPTNRPTVRQIPSAGALAAGAAEITVDTLEALRVVGCTDDDGIVYLVASGQAEPSTFMVYRSLDDGRTWEGYLYAIAWGDNTSVVAELKSLVASCGQLHLMYRPDTGEATSIGGNVAILTLGGWSQVEHGTGAVSQDRTVNRHSYGMLAASGQFHGTLWIPYNAPDLMGWTQTVANGIVTLGSGQPGLSVACTAGQGRIWEWNTNGAGSFGLTAGEAILIPTVLSATLATIGTADTGLFIRPFLGNAGSTQEWSPIIDIGRDGLQVRDGTSIVATTNVTLSTNATHIRWILRQGAISVWYRREGIEAPEQWIRVANDVAIASTGASDDNGVRWGCGGGSAAAATWRMVGVQAGGEWLNGIDGPAQAGLDSTDGLRGLRWGRPLPGAGALGYPIPFATSADEDIGRMSATGGPTHTNEVVDIPVRYVYGVHHIDPLTTPSPRTGWRAVSPTTQVLVYALDDAEWQGGGLAVAFDGLVASSLEVELDDGVGGWEPPIVVDLELVADFRYICLGRAVSPSAGTDVPDRYFGEGELVRMGVWLKCETTTGHAWRRVVENSGGYITADSSVQQVRITLAESGEDGGVDGEEVVTGTGALRIGRGVHIHYPELDLPHAAMRITVEPPDTDDNAVVRAGMLTLGRVLAVGGKPVFGSTQTMELTRQQSRTSDGTPFQRKRGPPRRVWAFPFTGGILLEKLRFLSNGTDHMGIGGGSPIGTDGDAFHTWTGAIEYLMDSGARPCMAIPRLPDADATISDTTLSLYGLMVSDSVGVTLVTGEEGVNEALRIDSAAIEEIR